LDRRCRREPGNLQQTGERSAPALLAVLCADRRKTVVRREVSSHSAIVPFDASGIAPRAEPDPLFRFANACRLYPGRTAPARAIHPPPGCKCNIDPRSSSQRNQSATVAQIAVPQNTHCHRRVLSVRNLRLHSPFRGLAHRARWSLHPFRQQSARLIYFSVSFPFRYQLGGAPWPDPSLLGRDQRRPNRTTVDAGRLSRPWLTAGHCERRAKCVNAGYSATTKGASSPRWLTSTTDPLARSSHADTDGRH